LHRCTLLLLMLLWVMQLVVHLRVYRLTVVV
jgi:hypothetical protein